MFGYLWKLLVLPRCGGESEPILVSPPPQSFLRMDNIVVKTIIPPEIINTTGDGNNDAISYKAIQDGVSEKIDAVCYSKHMSCLGEYDFQCIPRYDRANWEKFALPYELFEVFISLMKKANIIPEGITPVKTDTKYEMSVPRGLSRHRAYGSLCAYRWAEARARLPYLIIKLREEFPDLPIWQIIHYAMTQELGPEDRLDFIHSWHKIGRVKKEACLSTANFRISLNLAAGIAMQIFWSHSEDKMKATNSCNTNDTIEKIIKEIAADKKTKNLKHLIPSLLVDGTKESTDILNPIWSQFYEMATKEPDFGKLKNSLRATYDEVTKTHTPIVEFHSILEK